MEKKRHSSSLKKKKTKHLISHKGKLFLTQKGYVLGKRKRAVHRIIYGKLTVKEKCGWK